MSDEDLINTDQKDNLDYNEDEADQALKIMGKYNTLPLYEQIKLKIAPPGKRPVVMRWFRSENAPSTRIQSLSDCLTSVSKTLTSQEIEEVMEEMKIFRQNEHQQGSDA
ncbi:hypothetical protein HBI24_068790 [Parastagonospora nodorum]|nr:hypothetical protein HBI09_015820 [Parastagonospora nodorum]KAH4133226.1 hypothetical protein HBH47_009850 [Parastagonospora nodorum]KAH4607195.1 hypothetical protein HBH82_092110 [Parastagonospora nodorum]KAH4715256.1 hypothetical protein HBH78_037060 [Parastagonospora nodorum]KAH4784571.1 hypothetical protein HBH62_094040 [Parastagonospora nodorum]